MRYPIQWDSWIVTMQPESPRVLIVSHVLLLTRTHRMYSLGEIQECSPVGSHLSSINRVYTEAERHGEIKGLTNEDTRSEE